MLGCKDITEHASDYIDKKLSLHTRIKMKMHLLICVHCRRYIHQIKTTVGTLKRLKPSNEISEDKLEQTVKALLKDHHDHPH